MTNFPTNKDLAQKIDDLPDELIKRFDDRYLKKDDANSKFVTRMEAKVVGSLLTFGVVLLTFWEHIVAFFKTS